MLVSLTVGKVDAGVAVLLTEDKRLIEFPSILLPADIASGSIVDVNVTRNLGAEKSASQAFHSLQSEILHAFGSASPAPPNLRCRNATQTSVVLEWDPIELATSQLRSLSLYRNGSKAGNIPRPLEMTSTKISGLAVDTEYSFFLVLRTSGGTHTSERLVVRTHKMTDLTGITVTPGIMASALRESLLLTAERIGAKVSEQVRIDTTHFVCTEGRGAAWEKAVEMNVPVVVPDWIKGCEREGRIVGVRGYYLNADPKLRNVGPPGSHLSRADSLQQVHNSRVNTPTTEVTPPTPEQRQREFDDNAAAAATATAAAAVTGTTDTAGTADDEEDDDDDDDNNNKSNSVQRNSYGNGYDATHSAPPSPIPPTPPAKDDVAEGDSQSAAASWGNAGAVVVDVEERGDEGGAVTRELRHRVAVVEHEDGEEEEGEDEGGRFSRTGGGDDGEDGEDEDADADAGGEKTEHAQSPAWGEAEGNAPDDRPRQELQEFDEVAL